MKAAEPLKPLSGQKIRLSDNLLKIEVTQSQDKYLINRNRLDGGGSSRIFTAIRNQKTIYNLKELSMLPQKSPQSKRKTYCSPRENIIAEADILFEASNNKQPIDIIQTYRDTQEGMEASKIYLVLPPIRADLLSCCREITEQNQDVRVCSTLLVLKQLLGKLELLDEKKISHWDLKPDNIFIVSADNRATIDIGDFGSALSSKHNKRRKVGIYPGYAPLDTYTTITPPHQSSKARDIWAMGTILIELLTGDMIFSDNNRDEDRNAKRQFTQEADENVRKSMLPEELYQTPEIANLALKMLHPDPKKRPSAKDLFIEVEELLKQQDEKNIKKAQQFIESLDDMEKATIRRAEEIATEAHRLGISSIRTATINGRKIELFKDSTDDHPPPEPPL